MTHRDPRDPPAGHPDGAFHLPGQPLLLSRRALLALGAAAATTTALARPAGTRAATAATAAAQAAAAAAPGPRLRQEQLDSIVAVAIHPGLGIARLGNSADAFFIGPEVSGATPPPPARLRDASGAVARQAARFRLFGYDEQGRVVGEVRSTDAEIEWGVQLANRKAAWYEFAFAMDVPEAVSVSRHNPGVSDRDSLVLDSGRRVVTPGGSARLNASVKGVRLLLGEILTDPRGRLLVLPGHGRSRSWRDEPLYSFANNDGWLDDVADGPVTATVRIGSRTLEARSAWASTAPPNFAPGFATGWRTMHDVVESMWVGAGMLPAGRPVSFQEHIRPLFVRLAALQWLNAGILRDWGWKSGHDLSRPAFLARLADPSADNRPWRRDWARRFRDVESGVPQPDKLPPILGDSAPIWSSPRAWTGPTPLQRYRLDEWAAGRFEPDSTEPPEVPARLADLPLHQRPRSLDRAALEGCLGESFHPGVELPWVLRRRSMWTEPYRLRIRSAPEPDFGDRLGPTETLARGGPTRGCIPGGLVRWMALPWQADAVNCRSGYSGTDEFLDTFWAARVPNQVLTQRDYAIVMDTGRAMDYRKRAFRRRRPFLRGMFASSYLRTNARMAARWHELGFIVERPGPGDEDFPDRMWVEAARQLPEPAATAGEPPALLPRDPPRAPRAR